MPKALKQLRVVDRGHQVAARYVLQIASRGRGVGERERPPQVEVLVIQEQERSESGEADDGEFPRCRPSLAHPETAQRIPPSGPTPKESGPPQGRRTTPGRKYLWTAGERLSK